MKQKRALTYRSVDITDAGPGPISFTFDSYRPFGVIAAALKIDINRVQLDGYNIVHSTKKMKELRIPPPITIFDDKTKNRDIYFVPIQSDGSLPRPFNHVSANKSVFSPGATKSSYKSTN